MKGVFIALEGIDGCGKGTIIKRLSHDLFDMDKNHHVFLTREPYKRDWLKKFLAEPHAQKRGDDALRLFVHDRLNHCALIKPMLDGPSIVLTDRYKHSTYAYQMAQGKEFDTIHHLHKETLVPDLTIVIDIPVEEAINRMDSRGERNQFEQMEFLTNVRNNYLALKDTLNENIIYIDGNRERDSVYADVRAAVLRFLEQHKSL